MGKNQWGLFESSVFNHGALAAACGLLVTYLPSLVGLIDWGPLAPVVTVVAAAIVSAARLFARDNSPANAPRPAVDASAPHAAS